MQRERVSERKQANKALRARKTEEIQKYIVSRPNDQLRELERLLVILLIVSRSAAMCSKSIPSNFCNDSLCQVRTFCSAPPDVAGRRDAECERADLVAPEGPAPGEEMPSMPAGGTAPCPFALLFRERVAKNVPFSGMFPIGFLGSGTSKAGNASS